MSYVLAHGVNQHQNVSSSFTALVLTTLDGRLCEKELNFLLEGLEYEQTDTLTWLGVGGDIFPANSNLFRDEINFDSWTPQE